MRPRLDLAAENEHVGPIECNIRFLKEKVRLLHHTLPFERLPLVMLVRMVQVHEFIPKEWGDSLLAKYDHDQQWSVDGPT